MNMNTENTAYAISTAWAVAQKSKTQKDAIYRWNLILAELDGMYGMANWVLNCAETMEFILDLKCIARIHLSKAVFSHGV